MIQPLSRRAVLRGFGLGGIAIALPPLERMVVAAPPRRLVLFHFPNGSFAWDFEPKADGAGLAMPPAMKAMTPFVNDINVVSGLSNLGPFDDKSCGKDDHQRAASTVLTGVAATPAGPGGASMDQVAATHIGGTTRFRSLVVYASSENSVHHSRMSARGINDPVEPIQDPLKLFNQLFGAGVAGPTGTDRLAQERRSILDHVRADIDELTRTLGAADKQRLDQHLSSVREIERSLLQGATAATCVTPGAPMAFPTRGQPGFMETYPRRVQAMLDLIVMALRCDLTRVASFSLGSTNNTNVYSFLNLTVHDHEISHYGLPGGMRNSSSPAGATNYRTLTTWKIEQFAYLLDALKKASDGGVALLDSCAVGCFSEMSNGDWHSPKSLPVMVAGKAGGKMVFGRRIVNPCDRTLRPNAGANEGGWCASTGVNTSVSSLWLTMLQAVGAPVTRFGDTDKSLPGLWV